MENEMADDTNPPVKIRIESDHTRRVYILAADHEPTLAETMDFWLALQKTELQTREDG